MSFVILAWNCKKFFIILSPGHLGEDGSIQENNRKVGKITNVNSDFMMVNSLENAKWCWRCCQLIWLSIPFNVNSHVNPSNAIKARKREVDLGAAAEGPWGEVGGARPDLPSTGDLKLQLPSKKKIGHFPHMFLSPDIEESCFRWARRTARFDSFWKRSRKVGSCGGCIIMVEHHSRNVEMKPTLHSFLWVCEFWETQNFLVQGSRSTSSWLRSSSPWRWRFKPIGASWRTRRRGLEGPICCFACSWLYWEL